MELADFAAKWCHPKYPPISVGAGALQSAETFLGVAFPDDYRTQIVEIGAPKPTQALLDAIVDKGPELHDLSELYQPGQIVEQTLGWRSAGMPQTLIAIGCDCCGNSFCFDAKMLTTKAVSTAPVLFWDHDFHDTEQIAVSFREWISSYLGSWSSGVKYSDL